MTRQLELVVQGVLGTTPVVSRAPSGRAYCRFRLATTPTFRTSEGWRDDARAAFLDGYGGSTGTLADVLLAYEVDKAVYEVVYETRNRPTHLRIPVDYLTGIES